MDYALSITGHTLLHQPASPLSGRPPRICLLVLAIWIMNAFDLLLTIQAQRQGLLVETNPIAQSILPHGPLALALFKILLVGFGSCVLLWHRHHLLTECMAWLAALVNVGVSFRWVSCYQLYEVTLNYGTLPSVGIPVLGMPT